MSYHAKVLTPEVSKDDVESAYQNLMRIDKPTKEERLLQRNKLFSILSHSGQCRAFFKKRDFRLLLGIKEILDEVIEIKDAEQKADAKKKAQVQQVVLKVTEMMRKHRITFDELSENHQPIKKEYLTAKYHCFIFGSDYYWNGTGTPPVAFQCHLAKGHTKESCRLTEPVILHCSEVPGPKIPDKYKFQANCLRAEYRRLKKVEL